MVLPGVVNTVQVVDLEVHFSAVQEGAAVPLGHVPVQRTPLHALFIGQRPIAEAENHVCDVFPDRGGGNEQHFGHWVVVIGSLSRGHQLLHAKGDHAGGEIEHMLQLIHPHLDDDQIQRGVSVQSGLQAGQSQPVGEIGILHHIGASIQGVFNDSVVCSQHVLYNSGPPLIKGKPLAGAKSRVISGKIIAPGVGIAKAEDVFHDNAPFQIFMIYVCCIVS